MRVALAHPFAWPEVMRGGERYLHDLAWYLAQAGHEVEIVTGTDREPGVEEVEGVAVHRYQHRRHRWLTSRRIEVGDSFGAATLAHLVRHRYDLVHALMPAPAIASRLSGHRTIYTDIGHPARADMRTRRGAWPLFVAATKSAHCVTALSHSAAAQVTKLSGVAAIGLHPGVRLDRFHLERAPRTGPPAVLFNSDLSERRKGLDHLVSAFARVLDLRPDARLLLAAPGDPAWALAGHDAAVVDSIDVVGEVAPQAIGAQYRAATVTALPSKFEAFGLVLVESLASGTPVVASDWGGPTEIITEAVGRVSRYGDVDRLAGALVDAIDLAARPDTPPHCHERAREWDWVGAVGPRHEELYARVVRRSKRER